MDIRDIIDDSIREFFNENDNSIKKHGKMFLIYNFYDRWVHC